MKWFPLSIQHNTGDMRESLLRPLVGDLEHLPHQQAKVVRIFTSSTFTDTVEERNILMEEAYPKLKAYCKSKYGLDFQVVDMRWGVRDESVDDHSVLPLCLQEIDNCKQLSIGPNFVILLGQKHGYKPFPACISQSEFESLMEVMEEEDRQLCQTWYSLDTNADPAVHVLQPISSRLPDYLSEDDAKRSAARLDWGNIAKRLHSVFRSAGEQAIDRNLLSKDELKKYIMSVTENEILAGTEQDEQSIICFVRTIEDLHANLSHRLAVRYTDLTEDKQLDVEAQNALNRLRDQHIHDKIHPNNIKKMTVQWSPEGGISKGSHNEYLQEMCETFTGLLMSLVDKAMSEQESSSQDALQAEVLHHLTMAQHRCAMFHGREEVFNQVQSCVNQANREPIVIYGASGIGKTSVMAMLVKKVRDWLQKEDTVVVVRFLGTTPLSSNITSTLRSIVDQLHRVFSIDLPQKLVDHTDVVQAFHSIIAQARPDKPIILILDSLDQLSAAANAHRLSWLPKHLPQDVYMFLSTLPNHFGILDVLRKRVSDQNVVHVPALGDDLGQTIIKSWLKTKNRSITQFQGDSVRQSLKECSLPIYVKLAFEEVMLWRSYMHTDDITLPTTVRGVIDQLFDRLEKAHGSTLVNHALGYITASKLGLSQSELEDILSLDDSVLDDVFQYHIPPLRRLPPLLWLRIQHDIASYLVTRETDGVSVVYWYHRQFIEAARDRYLKEESVIPTHTILAEYFEGKWYNVPKSFQYREHHMKKLGLENSEGLADRKVPEQPLIYNSESTNIMYNSRKLNNLPYHLLKAKKIETLNELIFSYKWIHTKLCASSIQAVIEDFVLLTEQAGDSEAQLVASALMLAQANLSFDPSSLSIEICGRLLSFCGSFYVNISSLVKSALMEGVEHNALVATRQCYPSPGGALKFTIEHKKIALKTGMANFHYHGGNDTLIALSECNSLLVWDAPSGDLLDEVEIWPDQQVKINRMICSANGKHLILASASHTDTNPVVLYDLSIGTITMAKSLDKTYKSIGFFDAYQLDMAGDRLITNVVNKEADCFDLNGNILHSFAVKAQLMKVAANQRLILFFIKETGKVKIVDSETFETFDDIAVEGDFIGLTTSATPNMLYVMTYMDNAPKLYVVCLDSTVQERKQEPFDLSQSTTVSPYDLAIAENGRFLIITAKDCIVLWDTVKLKSYRRFQFLDVEEVPTPTVRAKLNSDMSQLVAIYDQQIIVWSVVYRRALGKIQGYKVPMSDIFITQDGKHVITVTDRNRIIKVWNSEKFQEGVVSTPLELKSPCRYMDAAVDQPYIVVRGYSSTNTAVYDVTSGECLSRPSPDRDSMRPEISDDGGHVLTLAYEGKNAANVWDAVDLVAKTPVSSIPVSTESVRTVCISGNGKYVATHSETSPSENVDIKIWNSQSGKEHVTLKTSEGGLGDMFFAGNDEYIVLLQQYPISDKGDISKVKVFKVKSGKEVFQQENVVNKWAWAVPKSGHIMVLEAVDGGKKNIVTILNVTNGKKIGGHETTPQKDITFDASGSLMADFHARVIRVADGKVIADFSKFVNLGEPYSRQVSVRRLTPNGRFLAWVSVSAAVVEVGSVDSGDLVGSCYTHSLPQCFQVLGDNRVAVGCDDGRIMLLQIVDRKDKEHSEALLKIWQRQTDRPNREEDSDVLRNKNWQNSQSACCQIL